MDPQYNGLVGFSQKDLEDYFGNLIEDVANANGKKKTEIYETMLTWHNGFRFTADKKTLNSPCTIIDYLASNGKKLKSWSKAGGESKFLTEGLKEFPRQALQFIIDHDATDGKPPSIFADIDEVTGKINFQQKDIRKLIVFLFHSGYLSIRGYDPTFHSSIHQF